MSESADNNNTSPDAVPEGSLEANDSNTRPASSDGSIVEISYENTSEARTHDEQPVAYQDIPEDIEMSEKPPQALSEETAKNKASSKDKTYDFNTGFNLPAARIKRIIKQDGDVTAIATPAVYAVAAATELFVNYFTSQACMRAAADSRKRIAYKDFSNSVESLDQLQFLSQLIPQPRKLSELVSKGLVPRPDLPKNQQSLLNFARSSGLPASTNNGNGPNVTDDEMYDAENDGESRRQSSHGVASASSTSEASSASGNGIIKVGENSIVVSEAATSISKDGETADNRANAARTGSILDTVLNKDADGDVSMGDATESKKSTTVSVQNLLQ